ncbi:tripartite motif-containing protein 2-like isoform X1 [Montipora foliosa]|uniref:tripartite motif-containing protein 2-like isoform X1 n=1 Tax=Montipora foliosa TaxID=591990 RepID=UPI0035F1F204
MSSESLECSICREKFDDQQHCPRLLPGCGHSFCTSCLQSLLKKNAINCPTCRSTVFVPTGVASLPKNFALLDILLTLPHKENDDLHLCQICDNEKHPATSCCLDCKEYMCKDAARLHTRQKVARDHCVVSLEDLKANPKLAAVSDAFCPEHNDQFRFFDENCGHVVCRDCVTLKHQGHKCLSLAEAASKYRKEMDKLSHEAIALAEKVKAGEARLNEATDDLKQEYANTIADIQSTFKRLGEALAARERVLMSDLDKLYKTKVLTLTKQRDRLCLFQACLDSGIQRAKTAVQSSGKVQLLVARTDIVSTLGALKSQPPELDPQTNSILDLSVDLERLLKFLSEAGSVSENSACAANTSASGNGLTVAKSRENVTSFTITSRDSQGRALGFRGNVFKAKLKKGDEEKTVKVNLKENAFAIGSFTASYALPADAKGQYQLSLLLRGDHIQGSPFTVYLGVPIGKLSCTSCGRKSKGNMYYYYSNNPGNSLDNENVVEEYTAYCHNCCHKVHNTPYFAGAYFQHPLVQHTRTNPSKVKVCGPI